MSSYMNYAEASKLYDEARVAADVDVIYGIFSGLVNKSSNEIDLLDIGCGTGNYSLGFLTKGLRSITMVDASDDMLQVARHKTLKFKECVTIKTVKLPELDFPTHSFDVISCMQVLHHIDSPTLKDELTANDYPNMVETLRKAFDILRPGGVLLIDVMFEENCDSFWWTSLCPVAAMKFKKLRMNQESMVGLLKDLNYQSIFCTYFPGSRLVKKEIYDQIDRIDDPKWRYYLSQFKLVEASGELDNLIKIVKKAKEKDELGELFESLSSRLRTHGNHTTVFAIKP